MSFQKSPPCPLYRYGRIRTWILSFCPRAIRPSHQGFMRPMGVVLDTEFINTPGPVSPPEPYLVPRVLSFSSKWKVSKD
ncbi:hypothetical protein CEXT_511881 [Caerostris extrusa]|uniref:Uncharacterized protein n=1 Tax=Caerostris extrusa TaxID=172846 RepID=A0AAV4NSS2_CAEEX|nr:hypothetical protein CEXT_511881 [Caerostris extrusa]